MNRTTMQRTDIHRFLVSRWVLAVAALGVFLPLMLATPVRAVDTQTIIRHLQARYESLRSFEADFTQRLTNAGSGKMQTRTGKISYRHPQLIRWETLSPEKELLVVGKNVVWDYFAGEKTAYRYHTADVLSSKTMLRLVSGQGLLDEDFIVTQRGVEDGLIVLDLIPKEPEPALVQATLWVGTDYVLQRLLLIDFYGNENRLELSRLVLDPTLPESLFVFTPPSGTQIKANLSPVPGH